MQTPARIGRFEILGRLGEGAMGTVYRARDPELDRELALKTVSRAVLERPDALPRFRREARAAARLQHPNVVTVYELGEVDGLPFIAMELLEGDDLSSLLRDRRRHSQGQLLRVVTEICRGLDYAHKRGVVHRDVKPANVRVTPEGVVKLVDFGIARLADSHMTRTGMVLGTPVYVAPEVLRSGRADHRSDLWSVGVILYEVLSGQRPFDGDSLATLAYRVVHEPMPPLAQTVPAALRAVVERALDKEPARRHQDLAALAAAIEVAAGLSGPIQASLTDAERAEQLASAVDEARGRLGGLDLEGALAAARRAQALDPSNADVLALIDDIEGRLDAPTLPTASPAPNFEQTEAATFEATAPTRPVARPAAQAPAAPRAELRAEPRSPSSTRGEGLAAALRRDGAAALEDAGVFGEGPGTQTACLSPDAELLALAGVDGAVRLWSLGSRTCRRVLRTPMHLRTGREAVATAVAFSPDCGLLASGHVDGLARLWHVDTGREYPVRLRHDGGVQSLAFSPDARLLATGSTDGQLRLWEVEPATNGEARRNLLRQPAAVTAVCWSPAWLATAHANRTLRILDAATQRLAASLRGPEDVVTLLAFAGDRLVAAGRDKALRVFDVAGRSVAAEIRLRARPTGMAVLDAGRVLAAVCLDNAVRLFDAGDGSELATAWGGADESYAAVVGTGDGALLAVALSDGRLRLWRVRPA